MASSLASAGSTATWGSRSMATSADTVLAQLFHAHGVELHLYRNGLDIVPDVPRLLQPWQHPAPLTGIGHASLPVVNIEDHLIEHVIKALS